MAETMFVRRNDGGELARYLVGLLSVSGDTIVVALTQEEYLHLLDQINHGRAWCDFGVFETLPLDYVNLTNVVAVTCDDMKGGRHGEEEG